MTAEHAHGIDTGGEVEALRQEIVRRYYAADKINRTGLGVTVDIAIRMIADARRTTRASAADAVLAEARRLCCGNNPSAHHEATAKHSERMGFAGDLARAVRGM